MTKLWTVQVLNWAHLDSDPREIVDSSRPTELFATVGGAQASAECRCDDIREMLEVDIDPATPLVWSQDSAGDFEAYDESTDTTFKVYGMEVKQ